MSGVLPQGSVLGELRMEEVLFEFDGPKLFVARNAIDLPFFAVAVDEEPTVAVFLWVPMTETRCNAVRSGLVSLRQAIAAPEDAVFVVRQSYELGTSEVTRWAPADLPSDWLPDEDSLLDVPTDTKPGFQVAKLASRSVGEGRTLIALEFDRADMLRTEFPVPDLQTMLGDVQDAVNALAAEVEGKATTTSSIPEQILKDSELAVVDLQAASFVVVLAPTSRDRIVDMPLASVASERLVTLFDSVHDHEALETAVSDLEKRAFSKFKTLLQHVASAEVDLRIYLAQPGQSVRESGVTKRQAKAGFDFLKNAHSETEEVLIEQGILWGANVRTARFDLEDSATSKTYSGGVMESALRQIDGVALGPGQRYTAVVVEKRTFGTGRAEATVVHSLRSLRRYYAPGEAPEFPAPE